MNGLDVGWELGCDVASLVVGDGVLGGDEQLRLPV
jgi:hypothetical protein